MGRLAHNITLCEECVDFMGSEVQSHLYHSQRSNVLTPRTVPMLLCTLEGRLVVLYPQMNGFGSWQISQAVCSRTGIDIIIYSTVQGS